MSAMVWTGGQLRFEMRSIWTEYLREDELALVGRSPGIDRVLQRLAHERLGVEMMSPAYKASREVVWEAAKPTAQELEWARERMGTPEMQADIERSRACDSDGHTWAGPFPATGRRRWPFLRCEACKSTSEAWQHEIEGA